MRVFTELQRPDFKVEDARDILSPLGSKAQAPEYSDETLPWAARGGSETREVVLALLARIQLTPCAHPSTHHPLSVVHCHCLARFKSNCRHGFWEFLY